MGIARDAAGRGLRVLLCERGDLAGATSSASSKLIHGGLRYLEHHEFRLVREALIEREVLLRIAPHIAWPMRFVLPHAPEQRPAWMIRLGLLLYDHIGGRQSLPRTRRLDLRRAPQGVPLRPGLRVGFEYSDCWVDDARLVALNAVDAREHGAAVLTRTACVSATAAGGSWRVTLADGEAGTTRTLGARVLVNAAGPWVDDVLGGRAGVSSGHRARLVKGSHIVLPRLYDGEQAYILQNDDGRVVFVIPYEGGYSLVGTTDVAFTGDPAHVAMEPAEAEYLCRAVSRYFAAPVHPSGIVHSYSGVRSLHDDRSDNPSAVTRDYVLDLRTSPAPVLSVFGGKITTYRRLAEHAMDKLLPHLQAPRPMAWTGGAALPGGDLRGGDFDRFLAGLRATHPWLPAALAHRLARAYGTRTQAVLAGARSLSGLGEAFGGGLTEAELRHMMDQEWARTAEDALWRRSKLGLHLSAAEIARVADWMRLRARGAEAALG